MFDKGIMRAMIFLLVILLGACLMSSGYAIDDGFLGKIATNKPHCNIDCQNKIKKERNAAARMAAKKLSPPKPTPTPTPKITPKV